MANQETPVNDAIRVIEEFRKMDQEMQMQTAMIFLLIARDEGCYGRDLMQQTGLTSASVSRNVAALSKYHRKGRPGHDVVLAKEDPMDRRNKQLFLTGKGRAVINSIIERFKHGNES